MLTFFDALCKVTIEYTEKMLEFQGMFFFRLRIGISVIDDPLLIIKL